MERNGIARGKVTHVCSYYRVLCTAGGNAFESPPLGNGNFALFRVLGHSLYLLPQQSHIVRIGLIVVVQFGRGAPAGVHHGLGLAIKILQFPLNSRKLLSEEVLFLLFGKRFVDNGGDFGADFRDGRKFDEQLGNDFEACLGFDCGQDF